MSATAQSVIRRAVETLQDETSVRWTIGELARYFNDGRREVVMFRPDATATVIDHALVAGPRQTLPADGAKLLEVFRNTNGRAVRLVEREILDAQVPGWPAMTRATEIVHFMFDRRDPRAFLVYPPAAVGASLQLQAQVSLMPSRRARGIPDHLADRYLEPIAEGAKEILLLTPGSFADPAAAGLARAKFDAAIAAHAVDAFMGHAGQVPRARVSWF